MQRIVSFFFLLMFHAGIYAQESRFTFGIIDKIEINRSSLVNKSNANFLHTQPYIFNAKGIYISKSLIKNCFIEGSLLFSDAKYVQKTNMLNTAFVSADLKLTQLNINLNYNISKHKKKSKIYVFAGTQLLMRRWGEETYVKEVMPNTYWPKARWMTQFGIQKIRPLGKQFNLQTFAGVRYLGKKELIYDIAVNQFYAGIVFSHIKQPRARSKYIRCPRRF